MKIVANTQQPIEQIVKLKKIPAALDDAVKRALRRGAILIELEAAKLAPVDTGYHRAHITSALVEISDTVTAAIIGGIANYARFLEFGTKPHWVPVNDNIREGIAAWIRRKSRLDKSFKEYSGKLIKLGLWVKTKGTNKRHFVPFTLAPGLLKWAIAHDKAEVKAIWVKGTARPHFRPALQNNFQQACDIVKEEAGVAIQQVIQ
ncbi:MAG: HK97-gp10 family putative phage morphogenesis protein [Candidatus Xenobiia bacterium LiM19]